MGATTRRWKDQRPATTEYRHSCPLIESYLHSPWWTWNLSIACLRTDLSLCRVRWLRIVLCSSTPRRGSTSCCEGNRWKARWWWQELLRETREISKLSSRSSNPASDEPWNESLLLRMNFPQPPPHETIPLWNGLDELLHKTSISCQPWQRPWWPFHHPSRSWRRTLKRLLER